MVDNITILSASGRGSVTMANRDYAGYWLGTVDWGEVTGQNKLYSYYNQLGETIVSTAIGSRELSVEGWIIEHSGVTLRQRSDFLNSFISPVDEYDLLYNGWKIRFRPTSSVIYSRTRKSDNALLRKFLIQAICPQPFFTGVEETVAPFDFSSKQFRFPTGFGQASPVVFATTDKLFNTRIHNPGGFATGVTIRIDFIGDVVNPRVKDLQTNKLIGVNRAFANGDRLTMVTVPGRKSMTLRHEDQSEENVIKNRHVSTSWLQLAPGSNIWAVECDDLQQRVNMQVRVCFSPLYLEVE